MRYRLDTGILLRVVHRDDPSHALVRGAVRALQTQAHEVVTALQNVSEFWNVCTRPATTRGGLGLTVDETLRRLRLIERFVTILPDSPDTYAEWRGLVTTHAVQGVQVHDAKLVALMRCRGVTHLLTLNKADFTRYSEVTAVEPADLISPAPPVA